MREILIASLIMILALPLVSNSLALRTSKQDALLTGDVEQSGAGISTYVTGAWNVTYSTLRELVGGDIYMNYGNFCQVIEEYFIPFNQRVVGLFIGWEEHANTPTTDIPYYTWVDDWLSACDLYGIANFFYFGQWGTSSPAPSWWSDVLETYPDMQTYDRNGLPVALGEGNPISIDHSQLVEQYEEDLKQLWQYYGAHPSWVGWGDFPGDSAYYAPTDARLGDVGFANYSIANFAESAYYLRDVNETGFYEDGTESKIWEMFVKNQSSTVFGWGMRQDSEGLSVYGGTGTDGQLVAMRFQVPENLTGFTIRWYGRKVGHPPTPLILELYEEENELPLNLGVPVESRMQYPGDITVGSGWQNFVYFGSNLVKDKYYWIVFQTLGGDNNNTYEIYGRTYRTDESMCKVSQDGYFPSRWALSGSAVLWMRNMYGTDIEIYPMQKFSPQPNDVTLTQTFTPSEDIEVNTIFMNIADRPFGETPSTVQLVRTQDDMVLATGSLDQKLINGVYFWVPVILDKRIMCEAGVQYDIRLIKTSQSPWQWLYLITNPRTKGFQGQDKTFLFKLADMDFPVENYVRCGRPSGSGLEGGALGVTDTSWYAVRFKPSVDAPLSTVDVKIFSKYGTPADFKIALREDYDGTGTRPAGIDLENKTISAATVPSAGWLQTTGWNASLKADEWYWIVFSTVAPSEGDYRISETVNPTDYKLLYTSNRGSSWSGPPEVAEFIFEAATTAEVFKVEPEDAQFGTDFTKITDEQIMAQSFSPTSDIVAKGVLVFITRAGSDPGGDLTVELRRDSGLPSPDEKPSMATLVSGTLSFKSVSGTGLQCIDFDFPVSLAANETYWIVLRSSQDARITCPYYVFRHPEDSYGGTACKLKRSTDGGLSWVLPEGKEADIVFAVVQPTVLADYTFYGTADLASDIAKYHTYGISDEPLHGWNTYLNLQASKILKEATEWFEEYTNEKWYYIDANNIQLIEEAGGSEYAYNFAFGAEGPTEFPPSDTLFSSDNVDKLDLLLKSSGMSVYPWSSWGHWGDEMGRITSEQIGLYYRETLPLLARAANFFDWDPTSLSDAEQQTWSLAFGEILSRMRYYGGYYGSEKGAVNALFIGDKDIGTTLQSLTPALNVTLCGFHGTNGDLNLTSYGDFRGFDVIVWWADEPSMWEVTNSVQDRIEAFVQNGGGLVVPRGWPDWLNPILGFDYTDEKITPGNIDFVNYSHPILKPYSEISGYSYYWRDWKIVPYQPDPGIPVVNDTNGLPWISEHSYGSGRGIFCGMPFENWSQLGGGTNGSPRESYLILLNNAIFYAAHDENMLPVWWFSDYNSQYLPWHTQLWFTVSGKPGCPVLLWVTNNDNATSFEIHLNATFYGIDPNGWIAIDVGNWTTIAKGSGTDIKINFTIPEKSWKPIYICNQSVDTYSLYSNIFILEQASSPVQVAYTLKGPYKQTSWLIVNISQPVAEVTLNGISQIPKSVAINNLNSREVSDGWFYDSANDLLYIKFTPMSKTHIIRINLETTLPLYEKYPYFIPTVIIAVVAAVEVIIWANNRNADKKSKSNVEKAD
jgi:hypothetical protein